MEPPTTQLATDTVRGMATPSTLYRGDTDPPGTGGARPCDSDTQCGQSTAHLQEDQPVAAGAFTRQGGSLAGYSPWHPGPSPQPALRPAESESACPPSGP